MPGNKRVTVTAREVKIVRNLEKKLKLSTTKICLATGRNKSTIVNMLKSTWCLGKRGRPSSLTRKQVTEVMKVMRSMIKKANGTYEISLAMTKRRARSKSARRHCARRCTPEVFAFAGCARNLC